MAKNPQDKQKLMNQLGELAIKEIARQVEKQSEERSKLENIAGGPLRLNKDNNFDLTVINSYLEEHGLKLEIKYYPHDNRYGFSIYKEKK